MIVDKCKSCQGTNLKEIEGTVPDLEWGDYITVLMVQCKDCNCRMYEIDDVRVIDFAPIEDLKGTFDNVEYTKSDYDLAVENKNKLSTNAGS